MQNLLEELVTYRNRYGEAETRKLSPQRTQRHTEEIPEPDSSVVQIFISSVSSVVN